MHRGDIVILVQRPTYTCYVPDAPCNPKEVIFVVHHCVFGSRSPEFQTYSNRSAEFQAYVLGHAPPDKPCPSYTLPEKGCIGPKGGVGKTVVLPL